MFKVKPISAALATLIIAASLSGCGGGGTEPVSAPAAPNAAQVAAKAKAVTAAAAKAKAVSDAAAAAKAKAAAAAKAKAATAARAKAATAAKAAAVAAAAKAATAAKAAAVAAAPPPAAEVYYENCTAVRDAGADPIHRGDPGYGDHLDRDDDGIACE